MVDKKIAGGFDAPPYSGNPISITAGCNSKVAASIKMFSTRWGKYSARSRRYSIYSLLADTVDGAWRDYVASLPIGYLGRTLCEDQILSIIVQRNGFSFFHDLFASILICIAYERRLTAWIETNGCVLSPAQRKNFDHFDDEFRATASSLRELAFGCETKKPKKTTAGKLNTRRYRAHCEMCSEPTELGAVLNGASWPAGDPNQTAALSTKYCPAHRSKNHDGTWNPTYRRARRSQKKFEREVYKIEHHTCNVPDFSVTKRKGLGDPFLWNLTHRLDIFLDEEHRIRKIARELTDLRISKRKRQILMLSESGIKQSEIARRLGISRQAISKALKSDSLNAIAKTYHSDVLPHHQFAKQGLQLVGGYNA